jgi:hypothetical protein
MQVNPSHSPSPQGESGARRALDSPLGRGDVKRARRTANTDPLLRYDASDSSNRGVDLAIDNALLGEDKRLGLQHHLMASDGSAHHQSSTAQPTDYHLGIREPYGSTASAVSTAAEALSQQQHHMQQQRRGQDSPDLVPDTNQTKPEVGSEEWNKIRRDNHKEVERRRREAINKGISELADIVPDCDKHKGQILNRTVDYIKKLKEAETRHIEKLTAERLLTEQTITELSNTNKALKAQLIEAWKEVEHWKKACGAGDKASNGQSSNKASK